MKKLAVGCGIVVALLAVLGVGVSVYFYSYLKQNSPDTTRLEELEEELTRRFGEPEAFTPPLDGRLDPERLELYTRLREQHVVASAEVVRQVESFAEGILAQDDEGRSWIEGLREGLGTVKEGLVLAEATVDFLAASDSLLLDAGMGKGEYAYLTSLTLFCFLDWDPGAIEAFQNEEDERRLRETGQSMVVSMRELFLDQLQEQRSDLRAVPARSPAEEEMLARLEEELPRCQASGDFPFQSNLPPWQAEALRPFEERLRETLPTTFGAMMAESHSALEVEAGGARIQLRSH